MSVLLSPISSSNQSSGGGLNGLDVSAGNVTGQKSVIFDGLKTTLTTGYTQLWGGGGSGTDFLTAAETLVLTSNNTSDAFNNNGAKDILIEGLDGNFNEVEETLNLNGTSAVNTTNQYTRVNRISVNNAGPTKTNAGTIRLRRSNDNFMALIGTAVGVSRNGIYTVPAGKTFFLTGILITALALDDNANTTMQCKIRLRLNRGVANHVEQDLYDFDLDPKIYPNFTYVPTIFPEISEKTDIVLMGASAVAAANHRCRVFVEGILLDN